MAINDILDPNITRHVTYRSLLQFAQCQRYLYCSVLGCEHSLLQRLVSAVRPLSRLGDAQHPARSPERQQVSRRV